MEPEFPSEGLLFSLSGRWWWIFLPITSFNGPRLGFRKSRSRGKDEKRRQEKAKTRKKTKH